MKVITKGKRSFILTIGILMMMSLLIPNHLKAATSQIALSYRHDGNGTITEWMLKGDANRDGVVNQADVETLEKHIIKDGLPLTGLGYESGDIDDSGKINTKDATALDQFLVKPTFPQANYHFRVIDTPNPGYEVSYIAIHSNGYPSLQLNLPNKGESATTYSGIRNITYTVTIDEDGVTSVSGLTVPHNDVQFVHTRTDFQVQFKDYDGTILKSETVLRGNAATAPENPLRQGYTFAGWSETCDDIIEDKEIVALYRKTPFLLEFDTDAFGELDDRAGSDDWFLRGDINLNKKVDMDDNELMMITDHLAAIKQLSEKQLQAADINRDGKLDESDVHLQAGVNNGEIDIKDSNFPTYDFYVKDHPKQGYQLKEVSIQSMTNTTILTPDATSSNDFTLVKSLDGAWKVTGNLKEHVKITFHHESSPKPADPKPIEPPQPNLPEKPDKGLGFISNGKLVSNKIGTGDESLLDLWVLVLLISFMTGVYVLKRTMNRE